HDRSAFDLRLDPLGVDVDAAVDRGIHPRDRQLAFVINRALDDRGDIADEAAMRRNAEPVALRQLAAPLTLLADQFHHLAQPPGLDRAAVERLTIVPQLPGRRTD